MGATAGDGSFEEAFSNLFLVAFRVTRRLLPDTARAEDAAAEAMARALVRWRRLRTLDHAEPWVARVATNLALDEIRRHRRVLAWPEDDRFAGRVSPGSGCADPAEDAAVRLALGAALSALSTRQREVIALRYLADLDEAQVSRALGISVNSVKKHASRGRAALRERLGPNQEVRLALD